MSKQPLILHCPGMHFETVSPDPAPGVLCLDPGLNRDEDRIFTPRNLPLDQRAAWSWLSQAMGFGGQFARPGDISAVNAAGVEDFYQETSHSIRKRIAAYDDTENHEDAAPNPELAAQMTLLLGYRAERELLDVHGMGKSLLDTWRRFRGSLGLSDEDEEEAGFAGIPAEQRLDAIDSGLEDLIPWKPVMEAFLVLAPGDAVLFVDRSDIVREWLEEGIVFRHPPRDEWGRYHPEWPEKLPGAIGSVVTTGARLLGLGGESGMQDGDILGMQREVIVWAENSIGE